jgi:hypothetical protein
MGRRNMGGLGRRIQVITPLLVEKKKVRYIFDFSYGDISSARSEYFSS